jgi:hypothetical protein
VYSTFATSLGHSKPQNYCSGTWSGVNCGLGDPSCRGDETSCSILCPTLQVLGCLTVPGPHNLLLATCDALIDCTTTETTKQPVMKILMPLFPCFKPVVIFTFWVVAHDITIQHLYCKEANKGQHHAHLSDAVQYPV